MRGQPKHCFENNVNPLTKIGDYKKICNNIKLIKLLKRWIKGSSQGTHICQQPKHLHMYKDFFNIRRRVRMGVRGALTIKFSDWVKHLVSLLQGQTSYYRSQQVKPKRRSRQSIRFKNAWKLCQKMFLSGCCCWNAVSSDVWAFGCIFVARVLQAVVAETLWIATFGRLDVLLLLASFRQLLLKHCE